MQAPPTKHIFEIGIFFRVLAHCAGQTSKKKFFFHYIHFTQ